MFFKTLPKVIGQGKDWVRQLEARYGYIEKEGNKGLRTILQSAQDQLVYVLQAYDGPEQVVGEGLFIDIIIQVLKNTPITPNEFFLKPFFNRHDPTFLHDVSGKPGALFLLIADYISTNCSGFNMTAIDPEPYKRLEEFLKEEVESQRLEIMRIYEQSKQRALISDEFLPTLLEVDGGPDDEIFPSMYTNKVIPIDQSGPCLSVGNVETEVPDSLHTYFSNDLYARTHGQCVADNLVPSIPLAIHSLVNQETAIPLLRLDPLMDTRQFIEPNVPNISYVRIIDNHIVLMNSEEHGTNSGNSYIEYRDGYAVRFKEDDPGIQEVIKFDYVQEEFSKSSFATDHGLMSTVRNNCAIALSVGLPLDSLGELEDGLYCFIPKYIDTNSIFTVLKDFWQACGQKFKNFFSSACDGCSFTRAAFDHGGSQQCSHLLMHKFLTDRSFYNFKCDTNPITPVTLHGDTKSYFDSGQTIDVPYAYGRFIKRLRLCHCDGVHNIDILWWENSNCAMSFLVKYDCENLLDLENFDVLVV